MKSLKEHYSTNEAIPSGYKMSPKGKKLYEALEQIEEIFKNDSAFDIVSEQDDDNQMDKLTKAAENFINTFYASIDEGINDLRFKYAIAKNFKNSGVIDFIKGDKLAVEINSEGDKKMLGIDDVYILTDEQYKKLLDALAVNSKLKFNDQTGSIDKDELLKVIKSPLLTIKEFK